MMHGSTRCLPIILLIIVYKLHQILTCLLLILSVNLKDQASYVGTVKKVLVLFLVLQSVKVLLVDHYSNNIGWYGTGNNALYFQYVTGFWKTYHLHT